MVSCVVLVSLPNFNAFIWLEFLKIYSISAQTIPFKHWTRQQGCKTTATVCGSDTAHWQPFNTGRILSRSLKNKRGQHVCGHTAICYLDNILVVCSRSMSMCLSPAGYRSLPPNLKAKRKQSIYHRLRYTAVTHSHPHHHGPQSRKANSCKFATYLDRFTLSRRRRVEKRRRQERTKTEKN